jgi:hypothetical protein
VDFYKEFIDSLSNTKNAEVSPVQLRLTAIVDSLPAEVGSSSQVIEMRVNDRVICKGDECDSSYFNEFSPIGLGNPPAKVYDPISLEDISASKNLPKDFAILIEGVEEPSLSFSYEINHWEGDFSNGGAVGQAIPVVGGHIVTRDFGGDYNLSAYCEWSDGLTAYCRFPRIWREGTKALTFDIVSVSFDLKEGRGEAAIHEVVDEDQEPKVRKTAVRIKTFKRNY